MNTLKKLFAVLGIVLILSGIATSVVSAEQFWIIIYHEDQGTPGDKRFEKCMPEDAWNGHDDHTGDWRSDEVYTDNKCENVYVPPVLGCTDETANNYNPLATQDDGSCTYDPEECVAPNVLINGVCTAPTEPPVECEAPNVLINGVCTAPTEPPVVVTPPKTPLDVPTCEEMSKMSPEKFSRWTARWDRLGCYAQGYQTGSGDNNLGLILGGLGAALIALGFVLPSGKKIKLVD